MLRTIRNCSIGATILVGIAMLLVENFQLGPEGLWVTLYLSTIFFGSASVFLIFVAWFLKGNENEDAEVMRRHVRSLEEKTWTSADDPHNHTANGSRW
jgi:uncharacterized membrane protein